MSDVFRGRRVLVTGASSGIGADLAREFARRGADIVLTARRGDRLDAVAGECRLFGVSAEIAPADLADHAARVDLAERFRDIDVLVNNAGRGAFGGLADVEWERTAQMLELNIVGLTHLTRLFAEPMRTRGWGRILLVASTAAFQPVPLFAAYAASKSYVLSLGMALDVELASRNVRTTVLCPGVTETEFFDAAGQTRSAFVKRSAMTSAEVARIGADALAKGRSAVIAGRGNAAMAFGTRFAPRALMARLAYRMMRP